MFVFSDSTTPRRNSQIISAEDLEQLLRHTKYSSHYYDDDSDFDQEGEANFPLCLPTPLLLVVDDDSSPCSVTTLPLPYPTGCIAQRDTAPLDLPCRVDTFSDYASQSESDIYDTPAEMPLRVAAAPPARTPAGSTCVGADVECCHAIEKAKVKTVMCLNYMHGRRCRFGAHCAFAHGAEELRQAPPEMMAKKHAIVSRCKPLLTETPPPSYRDALAAPPVAIAEFGATPAYEVAVREQGDHLPPPLPAEESVWAAPTENMQSALGSDATMRARAAVRLARQGLPSLLASAARAPAATRACSSRSPVV